MKAVQLQEIGKHVLVDKEVPQPKENEVLVKVKNCGICGSDIPRTFVTGSYHFPTVLGHEFSGKIIDVGKSVDDDQIGKKVVVFPLMPCNNCRACATGNYVQCKNYNYFGSRTDGVFEEYVAVPTWNLLYIADHVDYDVAAMTEPATVAQHVINKSELQIGENIVIFGAGPIGLMAGLWAKIAGANEIIFFDVDDDKVEFAKSQGFKKSFNNLKIDASQKIQDILNDDVVHVVVEATGNSGAFNQCIENVGIFGRVVLLGNPHSDMTIKKSAYDSFMRKEARIIGIFNSLYKGITKNEWQTTINALRDDKLNLKPLITHKVSLDELAKAFEMIHKKKEFYCKVMTEL